MPASTGCDGIFCVLPTFVYLHTLYWVDTTSLFKARLHIAFYTERGDALGQATRGGCECPISGGIQRQVECGSGQPGLAVGNSTHNREVETR